MPLRRLAEHRGRREAGAFIRRLVRRSASRGGGSADREGNAVHATCVSLVRAFVDLVHDDEGSPLKGCRLDGITVRDGGMQITDDPVRFATYADILTRHGLDELTIEGESAPPGETSSASMIAPD